MHELSIAEDLMAQLETIRREHDALTIVSATIRVGDFSGVDAEALDFAFGALVENTPLAATKLVIERVAARARCRECGHVEAADGVMMICGRCGAIGMTIEEGRDLVIQSVELE